MTPSNGGNRKHLVSQSSVLSQPDLLSPEELFSQYTINEIQRNFQKIQRDIEGKKGELRTMVGERYRELINTADTIADMENTVQDIKKTLHTLQTSCKLEVTTSNEEKEAHSKKEEFWSIASQMKLLVDTPEKIWNAMENKNFLIAGQLYLLSRHIVTNLHLGNGTKSDHLTKFPVLAQQWGSISHFKPSILQGCREILGAVSVTDDQFTDSICTVVLLEGVDLEVLVREVLERRLGTVSHHLTRGGSVRGQLAECVESIICTLRLVNNNLITENRVTQKLNHLCKNVSTMEVVSAAFIQEAGLQSITRHLPHLVHSYHPNINCSLELPDMVKLCTVWWDKVNGTIKSSLKSTFHYVQSVTSVASLVKPYLQKSPGDWEDLCVSVLNKKVNIWEDILLDPINEHVKDIISTYADGAITSTNSDISVVVSSPQEVNVSDFVWNTSCKTENKLQQNAEGFLDSVVNVCNSLNDRFDAIYNDIINYTGVPDRIRYKEDHVHAEVIFSHVQSQVKAGLQKISQHISSLDGEEGSDELRTDRCCLLIQLCRCLVVRTPRIQSLLSTRGKITSSSSSSSSQHYSCITESKRGLLVKHGSWISEVISNQLSAFIKQEPSTFAMVWEGTTIKEETVEGGSVESNIPLPIYCSSYISTVLYALSAELYKSGCHGYTDGEVPIMLDGLNMKIVEVYETWLETAELSQNMALQYWLDFKYLTTICNVSATLKTDRNKKISGVVRNLETHIDPFDWDVFLPHLTANLHSLLRRTYNLYGAVSSHSTTVQAIVSSSSSRSGALQQTTHNVLLGNGMIPRFPLLPIRADVDETETRQEEEKEEDLVLRISTLARTLAMFSSPM